MDNKTIEINCLHECGFEDSAGKVHEEWVAIEVKPNETVEELLKRTVVKGRFMVGHLILRVCRDEGGK